MSIRSGKRRRSDYRRDMLEIAVEILREATGGTTRQETMMAVFLSFVQARRYLSLLVAWDFLEYQSSRKIFRITPKGTAFLKAYENINMLVMTG